MEVSLRATIQVALDDAPEFAEDVLGDRWFLIKVLLETKTRQRDQEDVCAQWRCGLLSVRNPVDGL